MESRTIASRHLEGLQRDANHLGIRTSDGLPQEEPPLHFDHWCIIRDSNQKKPGGLGAILTQIDEKGEHQVIAYASWKLVQHEKNYTPYLLEMQDTIWAMEHFDTHLRGRHFPLFTDHWPLEKLEKCIPRLWTDCRKSYQHVVIPLNLTLLIDQANSLEGIIQFYEDQIRDTYDNASVYQPSKDGKGDYIYINGLINTMNLAGQYNITDMHRQNLKSLRSRIRDLKELFPNVDATTKENAKLTDINGSLKTLKNKINNFSSVLWEIAKFLMNVVNVVSFSSSST